MKMSIIEVFRHCIIEIKNLRLRIVNKFIIGNLNINSLPNKFDQLREIALKYVDVLVITETKLDDTFITSQFLVTGFSVLHLYSHYDKKLLVGDFNREVSDVLNIFLYQHDFENLVKEKTAKMQFQKCT